jgi:uncharacterized 2Fe-2S/4Fe-4S cluster protein (DUF4445 family)
LSSVTIQPGHEQVEIAPGQSLMAAARQLSIAGNVSIEAPCGGKGICGRCRVLVTKGQMAPATEGEKAFLTPGELAAGYRLACLAVPLGPAQVEIPPESMAFRTDLQVDGQDVPVAPDPLIKRYPVRLAATTLDKPESVWQQIERTLSRDFGIELIQENAGLVQKHDPMAKDEACVVSVSGQRLVNLYRGSSVPPSTGLAVDLGTTKVAGYLVDLETGALLGSEGVMNPQLIHGADVVNRLAHAIEDPEKAALLSRLAGECINHLADILTRRHGLAPQNIEHAVIAGNTAMHHLLLNWPVTQLARSPFIPASTTPVEAAAHEMGLDFAPGALVYMMPIIAGYVGGDHTAMALACRIQEAAVATLGLDIGTNTEMVLANRGRLSCCSCASGPAFEGAHIRQGVRAVEGAVYQVVVAADGSVSYQTIGGKPPVGLCGSGVVDAVAGLVRAGVINSFGIINREHPMVRVNPQDLVPEFVLAAAKESGAKRDLVLSQGDISAIQLAKAAVASGIDALTASAGIQPSEIQKVIVAGAFGTRLSLESAIGLGMLPDLPRERFSQVGNAAGTGARMVLTSATEKRSAEALARQIHYLELAAHPRFGHLFSQALKFPLPGTLS